MAVDLTTVKKCVTRLQEVSARFIWEIQQISRSTDCKIVHSDTFSCDNDEAIKWRLEYCQIETIWDEANPLNYDFHLCLMSSDKFNLNCIVNWYLLDEEHRVIYNMWNVRGSFPTLDDPVSLGLLNPELIQNDKLFIYVQLTASFEDPPCYEDETAKYNPHSFSLSRDLHRLLDDDSGDLTLLVGDQKIKVHKTIVSARSPVLAAMLDEDKDCEELHIPDVDYDVMQRVVYYMYTDQVVEIKKMAPQLYPLACRFKLLALLALCEEVLNDSLTVGNAVKTFLIARGAFQLFVFNFMKRNRKMVMEAAGFKSLAVDHPQLFLEVFRAINDLGAHVAG